MKIPEKRRQRMEQNLCSQMGGQTGLGWGEEGALARLWWWASITAPGELEELHSGSFYFLWEAGD